jgi:uncharacterized protein with HEPN domain
LACVSRAYLRDIQDSITALQSYIDGVSFSEFENNRMIFSASIREFQIIAEAVGKINPPLTKQFPDIPWQRIKDFRNILVHQYFEIDSMIVWDALKHCLPSLATCSNKLLSENKP